VAKIAFIAVISRKVFFLSYKTCCQTWLEPWMP